MKLSFLLTYFKKTKHNSVYTHIKIVTITIIRTSLMGYKIKNNTMEGSYEYQIMGLQIKMRAVQ